MSGMTLRIPRELVSPNKWNGRHWRVKHRISQDWQQEIDWAVIVMQTQAFGAKAGESVLGLKQWAAGRQIEMPVPQRMRVTVVREVPSGRNFIRDDDNLRFSVKPLLDALKRGGYIKNDSRKWIELPMPEQTISLDGKFWTVIALSPCEASL